MSSEVLEETLGKEVRETVERQAQKTWDIQSALEAEWTYTEQNPPDTLDKDGWTRNVPVTAGSEVLLVINTAKDNYNISSSSHTVKRLARYGLSTIRENWPERFEVINEYQQAATELSQYASQRDALYSLTQEKTSLSVDWGRAPRGERQQYRVIWYQKYLIRSLSDLLGVTQADILQWAVLESGKALGSIGVIAPPKHEDLTETVAEIEANLEQRITEFKSPVDSLLMEALNSDYAEDVERRCKRKYPNVWQNYVEKHRTAAESISDDTDHFLSDINIR